MKIVARNFRVGTKDRNEVSGQKLSSDFNGTIDAIFHFFEDFKRFDPLRVTAKFGGKMLRLLESL